MVTPGAWAAPAYSTIFAVVVGYVLWYTGVQRIGSVCTAIYSNLTPFVSLVSAAVLLGDRLAPLQLIGAVVVIAGIWLTRRGRSGVGEKGVGLPKFVYGNVMRDECCVKCRCP